MKQLLSIDADFLFTESKRTPLHISTVIFYDAGSLPQGHLNYQKMVKILEHRLGRESMVRCRLIPSPFNLGASYWKEVQDFDIRNHILHICLPRPCNRHQLNRLLAEIDDYPMNNTQPPWDAYFIEWPDPIEGLPDKCFCMVIRMHHSYMKDTGDFSVLRAIHALSPKHPYQKAATDQPVAPQHDIINIPINHWYGILNKSIEAVLALTKAKPAISRANRLKKEFASHPNKDFVPTRFNGKITPNRVLITKSFDLQKILKIKDVVRGSTVNDIIIALISGAMRIYLQEKKELPATDLTAILPIYTRSQGKTTEENQITAATVNLGATIDNPVKRIKAIHKSTVENAAYCNAVKVDAMLKQANSLASNLVSLGIRTMLAAGLANAQATTAITHVPGPQVALYMGAARVIESYYMAPLVTGIGLSHVITSYCNKLLISITSCKKILPDPDFYEQCLAASYARMLKATSLKPTPPSREVINMAIK